MVLPYLETLTIFTFFSPCFFPCVFAFAVLQLKAEIWGQCSPHRLFCKLLSPLVLLSFALSCSLYGVSSQVWATILHHNWTPVTVLFVSTWCWLWAGGGGEVNVLQVVLAAQIQSPFTIFYPTPWCPLLFCWRSPLNVEESWVLSNKCKLLRLYRNLTSVFALISWCWTPSRCLIVAVDYPGLLKTGSLDVWTRVCPSADCSPFQPLPPQVLIKDLGAVTLEDGEWSQGHIISWTQRTFDSAQAKWERSLKGSGFQIFLSQSTLTITFHSVPNIFIHTHTTHTDTRVHTCNGNRSVNYKWSTSFTNNACYRMGESLIFSSLEIMPVATPSAGIKSTVWTRPLWFTWNWGQLPLISSSKWEMVCLLSNLRRKMFNCINRMDENR